MSRTQKMSPNKTQSAGCTLRENNENKDFKNLISNQRLTHKLPKDRGPLKVADPSLPTRARGQRHGPRRMDSLWVRESVCIKGIVV